MPRWERSMRMEVEDVIAKSERAFQDVIEGDIKEVEEAVKIEDTSLSADREAYEGADSIIVGGGRETKVKATTIHLEQTLMDITAS